MWYLQYIYIYIFIFYLQEANIQSPEVMTEVECSTVLDDFVNSGRTGRRNAVADILDEKAAKVSTGGLPFDMEKLNCSGSYHKHH